ncbi:MAG TPA: transglutaminase domain-containing protein [Microthrixaceae bacterium]|nr:transglutaminase domain-containing protein [Microthrixaceae bacterium]
MSLPGGDGQGVSSNLMAQAAAVCAVLAIFGLRSVPIRWIVRGLALFSGLLLARFGELGAEDGLTGSWKVLVWLGALGAALVLAPSSRAVPGAAAGMTVRADSLPDPTTSLFNDSSAGPGSEANGSEANRSGRQRGSGQRGSGRGRRRSQAGVPAALMIASVTLVGAIALLLGPRISNSFPTGSSASNLIDRAANREDNSLVARDVLDMTSRPALTDKVVMTVRSPIGTFWRTEIFDRWDGARWTRSDGGAGRLLASGSVVSAPDDIAAKRGTTTVQQFRIESGFATAVPSAASPVRVESKYGLAQRPNGTITSPFEPLGVGSTYTVESRQMNLNAESLSAQVPARKLGTDGDALARAVMDQYGRSPVATDRVRDLARSVTSGAKSDMAKVKAIEGWMDTNTTYSLDAPLSPKGVDVVDHFLFDSQEGWCEQIASSFVVLARLSGVPARLVTGFAPGQWDPVGRRFVVREREAHAWTEVWFPESGWVPFDPTADVPLSGSAEAAAGADARDWREVGGILLLIVGLVALSASPLARFVERQGARLRERRARRSLIKGHWDVAAAKRLERIGASAGRKREPSETLARYGAAVSEVVGDPRVGQVGVLLDREAYGPGGPKGSGEVPASGRADAEAFVESVLSDH